MEEQPHKLEHVIKVAHACLHPQEPPLDTKSEVSVESGELGSDGRSRNGRNCRIPPRSGSAAPALTSGRVPGWPVPAFQFSRSCVTESFLASVQQKVFFFPALWQLFSCSPLLCCCKCDWAVLHNGVCVIKLPRRVWMWLRLSSVCGRTEGGVCSRFCSVPTHLTVGFY